MKTKKSRTIAFLLVFALLIATVIVTSVANAKTTDIQITADKTELKAGESATISVKVTTNYPVATMSIPIFYDKTLVDVNETTSVLTGYSVAATTTDSQSVDASKVYANTKIDSNKFGFVLATYIGGANKQVAESIDEVVLTFKITAKADVSGSAAIKVVKESAKTSTNVKGMLYSGASTSGKTITEIPENVENITLTNATANVKIGADKPQLKLTEKGKAQGVYIDTISACNGFAGYIYGIDTDLDVAIDDYVNTDTGYVVVTENAQNVFSTGATIELYNNKDELVATYVFIFFGDVDGEGSIDNNDVSIVDLIANWVDFDFEGGDGSIEAMAADLDGNADIDNNDVSSIDLIANWVDFPTQAELAAAYAEGAGISQN